MWPFGLFHPDGIAGTHCAPAQRDAHDSRLGYHLITDLFGQLIQQTGGEIINLPTRVAKASYA